MKCLYACLGWGSGCQRAWPGGPPIRERKGSAARPLGPRRGTVVEAKTGKQRNAVNMGHGMTAGVVHARWAGRGGSAGGRQGRQGPLAVTTPPALVSMSSQ